MFCNCSTVNKTFEFFNYHRSGKSHPETNQKTAEFLETIFNELRERREDCVKLKEKIERLETIHKDFQDVSQALEGERYRAERLEEQINDLTELHQVFCMLRDFHTAVFYLGIYFLDSRMK